MDDTNPWLRLATGPGTIGSRKANPLVHDGELCGDNPRYDVPFHLLCGGVAV